MNGTLEKNLKSNRRQNGSVSSQIVTVQLPQKEGQEPVFLKYVNFMKSLLAFALLHFLIQG